MKIFAVALTLAVLAGCNWGDAHRDDSHEPPGKVAGREAYQVEQDAKKAAKEVSKDLKSFSHDAREGYQEQKKKDQQQRKPDGDPK
jgi:hypothetical protein